jgi:PEP-CTERM motif
MARFVRLFPLAFLFVFSSTTARAEPFTILPNGDLVFNVSLTASGSFTCGSVVSCTGSGTNSITLQSGRGTATFSFTPIGPMSFAVGNVAIPLTLGTFLDSTTPGFELPSNLGLGPSLFFFDFTLTHTSPVPSSASLEWRFNRNFDRSGEGQRTYLQFPIGPIPPQYQYTGIIYSMRADGFSLPSNGVQSLIADVGVVPEPASMVLVTTGLVGAWWRRRRTPASRR